MASFCMLFFGPMLSNGLAIAGYGPLRIEREVGTKDERKVSVDMSFGPRSVNAAVRKDELPDSGYKLLGPKTDIGFVTQ